MNRTRRYLDHAATTWPKPPEVLAAWRRTAEDVGATAGRGLYREAVEATAIQQRARAAVARLLGGVDPERVALPAGCTLGLNTAIHGLVRPGDHVLATAADHNATLRPLHALATRGVIDLTIVPCDAAGQVDPAAVAAAWRPHTRLVVCSHVSNVTGAVQDVAAIATIAHDRGGLVLLDAAQSLGVIPTDRPGWGADIAVASAHKWLHGLAGAAFLWSRAGVEPAVLVQGGTGSASESLAMPDAFTERLEAGTPDVPALAAAHAAVGWLEAQGVEAVASAGRDLAARCATELAGLAGVRVVRGRVAAAIVSFAVEGYDPADVAAILEQAAGVQVRSGFHCAALVHEHLGTRAGGTVRASFGAFNTVADVEALIGAVAALTRG